MNAIQEAIARCEALEVAIASKKKLVRYRAVPNISLARSLTNERRVHRHSSMKYNNARTVKRSLPCAPQPLPAPAPPRRHRRLNEPLRRVHSHPNHPPPPPAAARHHRPRSPRFGCAQARSSSECPKVQRSPRSKQTSSSFVTKYRRYDARSNKLLCSSRPISRRPTTPSREPADPTHSRCLTARHVQTTYTQQQRRTFSCSQVRAGYIGNLSIDRSCKRARERERLI